VTMSVDEPERVTIEAFGHTFCDLLVGNAEDLRTLEKKGDLRELRRPGQRTGEPCDLYSLPYSADTH
jgi:hypothetical protein